jgi:hypothetical protein
MIPLTTTTTLTTTPTLLMPLTTPMAAPTMMTTPQLASMCDLAGFIIHLAASNVTLHDLAWFFIAEFPLKFGIC